MSYKLGKNLVCDCCGAVIFLETTSEDLCDLKFEDIPHDWTHSNDFGDMCPTCGKIFATKMRDMFGYDKLPWQFRNLML